MHETFHTMTADEIHNYVGPIFRTTFQWWHWSLRDDYKGGYWKLLSADVECPTLAGLVDSLKQIKQKHPKGGIWSVSVGMRECVDGETNKYQSTLKKSEELCEYVWNQITPQGEQKC